MELELPDLVEWNEKWKKEIDDLVGKSIGGYLWLLCCL